MNLSGGNQQKVMLARCLHKRIRALAEAGMGISAFALTSIPLVGSSRITTLGSTRVIVISSEMPEIMGLSDEIIIMNEGRMTGKVSGDEINEQNIIQYATEVYNIQAKK